MTDKESKVYGINFNEPLWDEEFPGSMDACDRLFFKCMVESGNSPYFASTAFLKKVKFAPKPQAIVQAVISQADGQLIPIYSVTDIGKSPEYTDPTAVRGKHFQPPKQRGYSKKWRGKWITKTELRRYNWLNKSGLKYHFGLSDKWIKRLEAWLAEQESPVRLQTNPNNSKWAPMRLYEKKAVEGFVRLHEFELKRWQKRYHCSRQR